MSGNAECVSGYRFFPAAALGRALALILMLSAVLQSIPASAQSCGAPPGGEPNSCSVNSVASIPASSGTNLGAGNPINVVTGNKYQREDDMPALPGVLGLEIVRHYNSAYSAPGNWNGLIGRGWRLSYETELVDRYGVIQVLQADGGRVIFSRDPKHPSLCSTANPANGTMRLATKPNGGLEYTWTWPNGRSFRFSHAGKLQRISAPSGESVQLFYDSANSLIRVIDPQGRALLFTYFNQKDAAHFHGVRYIDSPVGRFEYEYGSELPKGSAVDPRALLANLVWVKFPRGSDGTGATSDATQAGGVRRIYHHENQTMPWLLTGISVEAAGSDGKPARRRYSNYGYDRNGRAILSTHAGNAGRIELSTVEPGKTVLTNSLGQKTTYRYTTIAGEHRLLEVLGPGCAACGETNVRYGYNPRGQLVETTKLAPDGVPLGTRRVERDALGRVAVISEIGYRGGKPESPKLQVRFEYDGAKLSPVLIARPSVADGKEVVTRVTYNDAGQPLRVEESGWAPAFDGKPPTRIERTTSIGYVSINGRSLLARIDGPLRNGPSNSPRDSDVTMFEYDHSGGEARAVTNSAPGKAGLSIYDEGQRRQGILTRMISPGGRVTSILERDKAGRPSRIIAPNGVELGFAFDRLGHVVLRRTGNILEYLSYNEFGQLASVRAATGQVAYYTYDGDGRVNAIFDAQNNRIQINRNTEGRLLSRDLLNPDGSIAQRSDPSSLLTDPEVPSDFGQRWPELSERNMGSLLDARGLPEALFVSGATQDGTKYATRQAHRFADARGIESEYSFDDFGRLVRVSSADAGVTVFCYDAADHLTSKTTGHGTSDASTVQYRYDVAGRVIEQIAPEGKTTIRYGMSGRPVLIAFPAGEERYEYDAAARLVAHTRVIDGHSFTTGYAYDDRGQLSRKTLPDGEMLLYRYHGDMHPKAGLLAGIDRSDMFGSTPLLGGLNDADDGFAKQRYQLANGVSYIRELDQQGAVTRIGSAGIWEEQQRRDALGQLRLRNTAGAWTAYAYDSFARLVGSAVPGHPGSKRGYAYDAGSNLLTRLAGPTVTRYRISSANNHIVQSEADERSMPYFYNGAGSVERAGATSYRWDSQQRLIKVERDGKPIAEYAYNPFGERIKKVVYANDQRSVTYFFYDGNQLVAEAEPKAGAVSITRQYVWLEDAAGSRPIAMLQALASTSLPAVALAAIPGADARAAAQAQRTAVFAIVADHTGAPRAMVGEGRRTVWRADVLGYGEASPAPDNLLSLDLRGSNQYFDEETGLHYNMRRYLDPASGRYLSADPLGLLGGVNPYAFGDNNPVDRVDPLGLQSKPAGPVSRWAFQDKLKYVLLRVADKYPGELGDALKELVSPAALATTAGIFTLWAGAQFTPYGWVADIAMAGVGFALMGKSVWDVISGLYDSASLIVNAKCESDLQRAGDILAKGFGKAVVAAGSGAAAAGAPKIAKLIRLIFKDSAAAQKAATAAAITESWFGKFVPGRVRSGDIANYEHLARRLGTPQNPSYPPWSVLTVVDKWLNPGKKIYMVMERNATQPGGWATSKQFTSLAEARKELALLEAFKASGPNCCVLQEYIVKSPIPARAGYAGPLTSKNPPYDSYPGGAPQWELLLDQELTKNGGWRDFLTPGKRIELQ